MLRVENITKQFPGILANDHISLQVAKGEVHAVLGENGAGKSTLMNILYGLLRPDEGRIYINGNPVTISSPKAAIDQGIGMIHQHFMLVPAFTVAENVIWGIRTAREPLLELRWAEEQIRDLSDKYGLKVDPKAKVWDLPVGVQQRVEIIKALYRNANLLILDEPTAVLTPSEAKELFQILRRLTAEGHSVIFISHKLGEVMEISDRVTILRDGKVIATVNTSETDEHALAYMMVGREVSFELPKSPVKEGEVVLEVSDLHALNNRDLPALRGISFCIREGEILGLAGIDGNGQLELTEVVLGLRKATQGKVSICGKDLIGLSPREIIELDVAQIPEDRHTAGLILDFTIAENLILKTFYHESFSKGVFLDSRAVQQHASDLVREYDIRCPGFNAEARNLSGGNQQKVILARELCRQPKLIIAVHPTRGLDVGATEFVLNRLLEHREQGAAVLFISAELHEILTLSDRIGVIFDGQLLDILAADHADLATLGRMMGGVRQANSSSNGSGGDNKANSDLERGPGERDGSTEAG